MERASNSYDADAITRRSQDPAGRKRKVEIDRWSWRQPTARPTLPVPWIHRLAESKRDDYTPCPTLKHSSRQDAKGVEATLRRQRTLCPGFVVRMGKAPANKGGEWGAGRRQAPGDRSSLEGGAYLDIYLSKSGRNQHRKPADGANDADRQRPEWGSSCGDDTSR